MIDQKLYVWQPKEKPAQVSWKEHVEEKNALQIHFLKNPCGSIKLDVTNRKDLKELKNAQLLSQWHLRWIDTYHLIFHSEFFHFFLMNPGWMFIPEKS